MHSWHDFHITCYEVNARAETLSFTLEWPYESESDIRKAKLQFRGVECYYLEHDLSGGIVFEFAEIPLRPMLESWKDRFEAESDHAWPRFWRPKRYPIRPVSEELEDALAALTERNIRCYELSSSWGLSGWIMARSVEHQVEA